MMDLLQENHNCINGLGVVDEGPAYGRADVSPEHHQIVIQQTIQEPLQKPLEEPLMLNKSSDYEV